MAELRRDETGLSGVRRMFQDWVDEAAGALPAKTITDAAIHDARKRIKKARAALRLLRDSIGEVAYRRDNTALRDAARPLAAARDSRVLIGALDDLVERYAPATHTLQLERFKRVLRKEQSNARQNVTVTLVNEQRKILREVGARTSRWRLQGDDWKIIRGGLARVYRSGRKGMKVAARSRASDDLHDWRKQVKYLWHQLQMLEPVWPRMLRELASQTHRLADHLGDDHDLAVLRRKITAHQDVFEHEDHDALLALLDRRRKRLQNKAFKLGGRIFQEQPRRFVSRMGKYWRLWRAE